VAPSRPSSRLNLFSRHLEPNPFLELNTPFSTERTAQLEDESGNIIKKKPPIEVTETSPEVKDIQKEVQNEEATVEETPVKMSSQPPHPTLLIPGPIEFDDAVLNSMSHYR
jgi:alanine-glyoxylate transaminase/serine-glyoxylate transaminase/serine-pyruvate transaminase